MSYLRGRTFINIIEGRMRRAVKFHGILRKTQR